MFAPRPPQRSLVNIEEKLEELSALVAVAMNVAPEHFPSWSDGSEAHMLALGELWSEVRPHLEMHVAKANRLDETFQQLLAAFRAGATDKVSALARSLYSDPYLHR
jgi:hypothetical protein